MLTPARARLIHELPLGKFTKISPNYENLYKIEGVSTTKKKYIN